MDRLPKMDSKYKVISDQLGAGAFGSVYKVADKSNHHFAAKFMASTDRTALPEVRILSQVSHNNIIKIADFGMWGSKFCIVLEFADAGTLTSSVLEGRLKTEEYCIWRMIDHLASALNYLHNRRPHIMHRDLKPDNILGVRIGGGITWKLADFGLAKLLTADAQGRYYTDTKCGTEIYMAPEVLDNFNDYTFSADIWSLGAVITFVCNRRHLFTDPRVIQRWRKQATISSSQFSQPLVDLVASMLDGIKGQRPTAAIIVQQTLLGNRRQLDRAPRT